MPTLAGPSTLLPLSTRQPSMPWCPTPSTRPPIDGSLVDAPDGAGGPADVVLLGDQMQDYVVDTVDIPEGDCTITEGCVGGPGVRKLLRFRHRDGQHRRLRRDHGPGPGQRRLDADLPVVGLPPAPSRHRLRRLPAPRRRRRRRVRPQAGLLPDGHDLQLRGQLLAATRASTTAATRASPPAGPITYSKYLDCHVDST
jgi:hypothetical protein